MTPDVEANPGVTTMEVTAISKKTSGNGKLTRQERPQDEVATYAPTGGATFYH